MTPLFEEETVTVAEAKTELLEAETDASPEAMAVTTPELETCAKEGADDCHCAVVVTS